jgi:hypothetical protein
MPLLSARRSRRNVGRKIGSLSGNRMLVFGFLAIAAMSARKRGQVNAKPEWDVDGVDCSAKF